MAYIEDFEPIPLEDTSVFKHIKVGRTGLAHKIVMPPMARFRAGKDDSVPTDMMIKYYGDRSRYPGSMIITEAVNISAQAGGYERSPGVWAKEQMNQWKKIFDVIHKNKSFVWSQLIALGRSAYAPALKKDGLRYDGASEILPNDQFGEAALKNNIKLHQITKEEIKKYVQKYIIAAKNCIDTGADGVEIHSANGYLLNQFLDPKSNNRSDEYGGSIENRARFILEVTDALIESVGSDRVGIRFSPYGTFGDMSGGDDPTLIAQYAYVLGELEKRAKKGNRLAYVHVLEPRVTDPSSGEGSYLGGTNDFIYSIWKGIVIRSGGLTLFPKDCIALCEEPNTLVAFGRFFIANPDLIERMKKGLPLTKYDRSTFYTSEEKGYNDYVIYKENQK